MSTRSRLQNNNAVNDSQYAGFAGKRIYANVKINGKIAGKWMVDSGADVSVISNGLARQLGLRYLMGDELICRASVAHSNLCLS